jgi:large subunit ribosomal protein L25
MADQITLQVKPRSKTGKAAAKLRAEGVIPGILYGQGKEATPVEADEKEVLKTFQEAGSNRLVDAQIAEGDTKTVLFHDVQINPVTQRMQHFDLFTVKMDETIRTEVPIHFTGEATAEHVHSAIIVKNLEEIEVEALPRDLPEFLEVDLTPIDEIGKSIHVRDITVPPGVELLVDADEMIVKADPPRSEEEIEALDEEIAEDAEAAVEAEKGEAAEEGEEGEASKEGEPETKAEGGEEKSE